MYIRQKYRIYPNKHQEQVLVNWLGQARFVWNYMLSVNKLKYDQEKKFIFKIDMNNLLPELKKEFSWLKESVAQSLQQKCGDLDNALKGSFRQNKGFPKYKSKHKDTSGISFPQLWKITDKLYLPKMKSGIKIKIDTPLKGIPKTCNVSRNKSGQWHVSCVVRLIDDYFPSTKNNFSSSVGIDLGLKEFLTSSDGEQVSNPKFLKKNLKKLARLQRRHSKAKKGSKNREKKRKLVAKAYLKISNQRKDFIKKTANSIAKYNDLICIENLAVSNMIKNKNLARVISDVSWSMFVEELKWQATKVGSHVIQVDRFFASSKTCSSCGHKKEDLSLSNRTYLCDFCGYTEDRDLNAAINIKNKGTEIFLNTVGTTGIYACTDMSLVTDSGQEICIKSNSSFNIL